MNSDYAPIVKKVRDEYDANSLLSSGETNVIEKRFGNGRAYVPVLYFLFVGNSIIFAQRFGYLQSKNFFLASVVLSYPLASYMAKYVFGYKKLRDLAERDEETAVSSAYYNTLSEKKQ
jgi:hypothetical protein